MVEIYADCADLKQMEAFADWPLVAGFTTNPTLMKRAGVKKYKDFAKEVLQIVGKKPVSFEVLADDFASMEEQAREIASWGKNVYVKLPITNSSGKSIEKLLPKLCGINVNITAVMTQLQIELIADVLYFEDIISVFAGRIADTGVEPRKFETGGAKLLWASAREVLNYYQAQKLGYDIITLTPELIAKLVLRGKDLSEYSLETVKQFHEDGKGIEF